MKAFRLGVFIKALMGRHGKGQAATIALTIFVCLPAKASLNTGGKNAMGRSFRAEMVKICNMEDRDKQALMLQNGANMRTTVST